jgi:hypothetical protein
MICWDCYEVWIGGMSDFGLFECTVFTISIFYNLKWTRFSRVSMLCHSCICNYVHAILLLCTVSSNRKVLSLSSVALYRAARPRSGKFGVVLKPFPRSAYLTRKTKPFSSPVKTSNYTATNSASDVASSSHHTFEDNPVKEVASYWQ